MNHPVARTIYDANYDRPKKINRSRVQNIGKARPHRSILRRDVGLHQHMLRQIGINKHAEEQRWHLMFSQGRASIARSRFVVPFAIHFHFTRAISSCIFPRARMQTFLSSMNYSTVNCKRAYFTLRICTTLSSNGTFNSDLIILFNPNRLMLNPTHHAVVTQPYNPEILTEYVIRGNSAILKCSIPSYIAEFVTVEAWIREDGEVYLPEDPAVVQGIAYSWRSSIILATSHRKFARRLACRILTV